MGEYHPQHDMGAVRSTQERLAYFGTELGSLKSGRSFGEMVLTSERKDRNATAIADELTDLIIINEELYKKSFQVYNLEWKQKSSFALACPLFLSWPTALKALLIENLKLHKIHFGNRVVEQGHPCNSVYFIAKGAARVLSDPLKSKEQCEALSPERVPKKKEINVEEEVEKIELNAMQDLFRPLSVIERRRRRIKHGFVAMETRLRQREIQAATIGPNDVIGDIEMVLDIPEYCASVECVETLEVYELDKASFQRLIARRNPETLELLREVVIMKLKLRTERFEEIPLFKYLLNRAICLPQNEKLKEIRKKIPQLEQTRPLANHWQKIGNVIKATTMLLAAPGVKKGKRTNKSENKGETAIKEKETQNRQVIKEGFFYNSKNKYIRSHKKPVDIVLRVFSKSQDWPAGLMLKIKKPIFYIPYTNLVYHLRINESGRIVMINGGILPKVGLIWPVSSHIIMLSALSK